VDAAGGAEGAAEARVNGAGEGKDPDEEENIHMDAVEEWQHMAMMAVAVVLSCTLLMHKASLTIEKNIVNNLVSLPQFLYR
jgi:hypothetical protein